MSSPRRRSQTPRKVPSYGLKYDVMLKLIVFGEGGVGKTTMITRLVAGEYHDSQMTVGASFATQEMKVDGKIIQIVIWDFGGEERFRTILPSFCIGAHGGIMAFDLTRPDTFLKLPNWLELVKAQCPDLPILLVGMKCDLPGLLPQTLIDNYWEQNGLIGYINTSAKTNVNVREAFEIIAKRMWHHFK